MPYKELIDPNIIFDDKGIDQSVKHKKAIWNINNYLSSWHDGM